MLARTFILFLGAQSLLLAGNLEDIHALLVPLPAKVLQEGKVAASEPSSTSESCRPFVLTKDILATAIEKALADNFGITEGHLHVQILQGFDKVELSHKDWRVDIKEGLPQTLVSRFLLRVKVICQKSEVGNWTLPIACEWWQDVRVARRPVARGSTITDADFYIRSVDALQQRRALIGASQDLSHYELAQFMQPNQPLSWSDVAKKPDVRKGDVVEVVAMEGLLRVSMKGIALQDGRLKEFISVRNLKSNKEIQAQVINEKTVQVFF